MSRWKACGTVAARRRSRPGRKIRRAGQLLNRPCLESSTTPRPQIRGASHILHTPIVNTFTHVKPGDTPWVSDRLRSFFEYRDLDIAAATGGRIIAKLARAKEAPEKCTGWHRHIADFKIVIMLNGGAKFMYEGKEHLVAAGDRLRASASRHHALPVRLPARHGIPGGRGSGGFWDSRYGKPASNARTAFLVGRPVPPRPNFC